MIYFASLGSLRWGRWPLIPELCLWQILSSACGFQVQLSSSCVLWPWYLWRCPFWGLSLASCFLSWSSQQLPEGFGPAEKVQPPVGSLCLRWPFFCLGPARALAICATACLCHWRVSVPVLWLPVPAAEHDAGLREDRHLPACNTTEPHGLQGQGEQGLPCLPPPPPSRLFPQVPCLPHCSSCLSLFPLLLDFIFNFFGLQKQKSPFCKKPKAPSVHTRCERLLSFPSKITTAQFFPCIIYILELFNL